MVVLEALGLAATELFNYNREIFKFDNEQRIKKDMERVEMQIKRFNLFREDIADLVGLTVGKMDMYHMVGALMLAFTCTIYTEGLFRGTEPPWFTGLYYMTVCNSFVYLLLTVWLSMHASVQAQSYGVRLRTRYVRLPIPSLAVLNDLTSKYADFERQGASKVARIPFSGMTPNWMRREALDAKGGEQASRRPGEWKEKWAAEREAGEVMKGTQDGELIGRGDDGFGKEDILEKAAGSLPGRHIQLFRRLQAKWQCYDAYARVSMSIGVNQMVQAVNYFVIGSCLVERNNPSTAIAATLIFQSVAVGLMMLDIADKPIAKCLPLSRTLQILVLQSFGSAPVVLTMVMLICARDLYDTRGPLEPYALSFYLAPACYFLQAIWFQLELVAAWPSRDEATLPRKFLAVLFLDVFGDGHYDPTEAEQATLTPAASPTSKNRSVQELAIASAEESLRMAQVALRRWEAIPNEMLSDAQGEQLDQMRRDYTFWRQRLQAHISRKKMERGVVYDPAVRDSYELKPWSELTAHEKQEDEFHGFLVGPLTKRRTIRQSKFFYDLDLTRHVLDSSDGRVVLTLGQISDHVDSVKARVRSVLAKGGDESDSEDGSDHSDITELPHGDPLGGSRSKGGIRKERLPWKTVRRLTQVLQLGWLFLGVQLALQDANIWGIGWLYGEGEERRLAAIPREPDELNFKQVVLDWPHGGYFRPTALSCLPSARDGEAKLLIGSPYGVFETTVDLNLSKSIGLSKVTRSDVPPGTVAFCEARGNSTVSAACWLGRLTKDGVALWRYGGGPHAAVQLSFEHGMPRWQLLAGLVTKCDALRLLMANPVAKTGGRCLLLAGWDGHRIPVVVVPLDTSSNARHDERPGSKVLSPRADAPFASEDEYVKSSRVVAALHMDASSGRLWAVLHGQNGKSELHAWSVIGSPQKLASPSLPLEQHADLKPTATCQDATGLFIAGEMHDQPKLLHIPNIG